MKSIKFSIFGIFALSLIIGLGSCEKDARVKPSISFNTGAGYVAKDTTLPKSTAFKVGIIAKKTEDELKTYNRSDAFDGGTATTANNKTLTGSQQENFTIDENITTKPNAGTEKYEFTITDRDGNISSITLNVTVK